MPASRGQRIWARSRGEPCRRTTNQTDSVSTASSDGYPSARRVSASRGREKAHSTARKPAGCSGQTPFRGHPVMVTPSGRGSSVLARKSEPVMNLVVAVQ